MFQKVKPSELIPGKKYKIELNSYPDIKPQYYKANYYYCTFDGYYKFINVKHMNIKSLKYDSLYFQETNTNIYMFISEKKQIQDAMERRAVNKLIGNIIGDLCFVWY